jgi:hypothetical protein
MAGDPGRWTARAYHYLLVPHLYPKGNKEDKTAYWKHRDWQKAFATPG